MRAFHHPDQTRHDPRFFLLRGAVRPNYEVPARAGSLLAGLGTLGIAAETAPVPDVDALAAVHARDYPDLLASDARDWAALPDAGPEAVANVHPTPEMLAQGARPGPGVVGRAGWFAADTACPIGPGTWEACLSAAGTALAAAAAGRGWAAWRGAPAW